MRALKLFFLAVSARRRLRALPAWCIVCLIPLAARGQQPNFVFLFPDQLRAVDVGCYGEATITSPVSTPAMDTLAASGVRFHQALSPFPLCTPCRASILTGRMPYAVRSSSPGKEWMIENRISLHSDEITIAEQLKDVGYACGYVGKWHLDDVPNLSCIAPDRRQGFDWFEGYNAYGELTASQYYDSDCVLHTSPDWLPDVNTDSAVRFMTTHQAGPFFLMVSYGPPHACCGYNWSEIMPATAGFTPEKLYLWEMFELASVNLRPNVTSFTPDPIYQHRMYHAMIAGVDAQLARIRTTLSALGLAGNTIIMVSSDHGSEHGSHGDWDKNSQWEEAMRVPLIVYDPRTAPANHVHSEPVSLIDVMPSMIELAGGTPTRTQGRSFAPLLTGAGTYQNRDAVLVQLRQSNVDGAGYERTRILRTDRYKLVACEVGLDSCDLQPEALYDLQVDPYEMTNLVNNAGYQTIRNQLWDRLLAELEVTEDPLRCVTHPTIAVNPSTLDRNVTVYANPPDDLFTVANGGAGTLSYTIVEETPWLSVSPSLGTSTGEADPISIGYDTESLTPGDYSASIRVESVHAINSPRTVVVTIHVGLPSSMDRVAVDLAGHLDTDLGQDNEFGLRRPVPESADGETVDKLVGGRYCRRNSDPPGGDHYIYFRVDNAYAWQGNRPDVYITFEYQDKGTGSITLEYDSTTGAYAEGGTVNLTATDGWKQQTFHVTDAWFSDRQTGAADFRLYRPSGYLLIDLVQVGESPPPPAEIQNSATVLKRLVRQGDNLPNDVLQVTNAGGGKLVYALAEETSWLDLAPVNGTNIGESDTIQVAYQVASLAPGDHATTVTVADPNAGNSPQSLVVNVRVMTPLGELADFDNDGDIDGDDLDVFVDCAAGALVPQTDPACQDPDLDDDGDVDQTDFGVLQRCIAGPDEFPGC